MTEPAQATVKPAIRKRLGNWRAVAKPIGAVTIAVALLLTGMGMDQLRQPSTAQSIEDAPFFARQADEATTRPADAAYSGPQMLRASDSQERKAAKARLQVTAYTSGQPMLARKAGLVVAVKDLLEARAALEAKLAARGGYIASLQAADQRNAARELRAVLRVPAAQLDALLADLKSLGRVENESSSADEVTQQYVDLTARLHNARNTEQRLIDVLRTRTGKVADILEVEEEIARVREEIERMDAERKHMEGRVSHSSVELRMFEDYRAELALAQPSITQQLWNSLVDGLKRGAGGVFALANFTLQYLPALLLWALLLFWPVRTVWRRVRASQQAVEKAA